MVLICHEAEPLDSVGIASWLACCCSLSGIVLLRSRRGLRFRKLAREYRRVGFLRVLDVVLFRVLYLLLHARKDQRWARRQLAELRENYPADLCRVPTLVADHPNEEKVRAFISDLQPDIVLARCKFLLKPEVYEIPRRGTAVLHPGITPQYRNAHGCFWALVNRDLARVGMSLLKVDAGIDTGPVYLQASYPFNEKNESHVVIQHRVVLENLDEIARVLRAINDGTATPYSLSGSPSRNWGQPWMTAYLQWRRSVRSARA